MGQELKPCTRCSQERDKLHSWCKACRTAYGKTWRKSNSDKIKTYETINHDTYLAYKKTWREANPDKVKTNNKAWGKANPEKLKTSIKAWQIANPGKLNAQNAKRRAAKFKATPLWLTREQLKQIGRYYIVARWIGSILGESIHVDHVIPLQGENITGLHVPWNLQLLIAKDNIIKGNK